MRFFPTAYVRLPSCFALAVAGTVLALPTTAGAAVGYVRSTVGAPWGQTVNEEAMDLVFGAGGWDDLRYEDVNPAVLFGNTYTFLYLEGSDSNFSELGVFLGANQAALEAWVTAGGGLLMNAGPNQPGDQNWGFGGVTLNNGDFPLDPGMAVDDTHPIWNGPNLPIALMFTGGAYAHASVSGAGLVPHIIDSDGGNPNLAELPAFGAGRAMFGGLTTSNFWQPTPEALNLRANIIFYLSEGGGGGDADKDGVGDLEDNCPLNANPMQEDADMDGQGDLCDPCPDDPDDDIDGDLVCGNVDNCPSVINNDQADADADDLGDACDSCPDDPDVDIDGDLVCGYVDNCPEINNLNQADADMDGAGDVCDVCPDDAGNDDDGDGVCAMDDNCPTDANEDQADADGNGVGDACDEASGSTGGMDDTGGMDATAGMDETGGGSGGVDLDTGPDTGGGPGDGSTSGIGGTGDTGLTGTDTFGEIDPGGCGCATGPSGNRAGWSIMAMVMMLRLRRRRRAG
jgi:MYXO-CTERM domain-containing protein